MTENAKTLHARRVESDLDEPSGRRKCIVYFGYDKENFEEFRERVYEAVRQIHHPFPYNKFLYPITKTR
jgi:5,10-methylenetetrahydrofolate reductase